MNDAVLLKRAQKGETAAFEELVSQHRQKIYGIALRIMSNPEDAMDLSQEALIKIYRALPDFKGQSSFSTWVYRIVTNTCLDELRKRKHMQTVSADEMAENGSPQIDRASSADEPEAQFEKSQRQEILSRAIASLQEDFRSAIVLRDVQGFSYEEISEILSCPIGTVKSRISRARGDVRRYLMQFPELFAQYARQTR